MFETIKLYTQEKIHPDQLLKEFSSFGYSRAHSCQEIGDFARRGGIVDIFPVSFQDPIRIEFTGNEIEKISSFDAQSGKSLFDHPMVIILPIKGLTQKKINRIIQQQGEEIPIENFIDIEIGDLVVHTEHGIGKYLGIEKMELGKKSVDHMVIEYDRKERLYVPLSKMHLVQKYIGFEGKPPKLYKLGTKDWQRRKTEAKKGAFLFARELLEMQAKRFALKGYSFSSDTDWQKQLEDEFPYDETPDQLKAALEAKKDMESTRPMDRLICGDVGYGKTEVALRTTFKAVMDNKQVAILVPTTILAEQHYKTFTKRFSSFPVNVRMLSRFRTKKEQEMILKELRQGSVDVVIGTHRLLSGDVQFKNLRLVIIDEEQRFGVKDKEKLKKMRLLLDVLTLTATPIPRTLYLSLMGAKDISIVNTPPADRLPIHTQVCEYNEKQIREAVIKEVRRNGQIFFVHNRVKGIDKITEKIKDLCPEARISLAHGQMPSKELEQVMDDFIDRKIDMLVSTNIVESGIDIPSANTLIVNRADMFGLAELYQLRGRVGRFKVKAYAYLLVPRGAVLTKESKRRLQALEKFTQLGSGFKIAMEDLQRRGAGNILGEEQHGYITSVGFDLYCRLLREAVNTLKKS